jgi:hypothetical protein
VTKDAVAANYPNEVASGKSKRKHRLQRVTIVCRKWLLQRVPQTKKALKVRK